MLEGSAVILTRIVNQERQICLLLRRKENLWAIPGGKIEEGETPLEAVRRELFEEAGVLLDESRFTSLCQVESLGKNDLPWITHYFAAEYGGSVFNKDPHSHETLSWIPVGETDSLEYFAPCVVYIDRYGPLYQWKETKYEC